MRHKLIALCLVLWFVFSMPLASFAADFDADGKGTISVILLDQDKQEPIAGAELSLYRVASVKENHKGNLIYTYTKAFKDCDISIDDPSLAEQLDTYVKGKVSATAETVTDAQGKAIFGNVPLGLYFVKQERAAAGYAPCTPFLVMVPDQTEDGYVYDVDASPKTEAISFVDITIRKVWNTDKSTEITDDVTVQLLRHDEVVETATLSAKNQWQVTYKDMLKSDAYSINEVNVPKGFVATYTQKGYDFTVTNSSSLIYTGQIVWPIPVLAIAGLCFLAIGTIILQKSRVHHG